MNLSLTSIGKNLAHASLSLSICRVQMLHSAWSIASHRPYRAFQWSSWDHFLFLSVKVEDALKPQKNLLKPQKNTTTKRINTYSQFYT